VKGACGGQQLASSQQESFLGISSINAELAFSVIILVPRVMNQ
tara:strand:- start:1 stop:129 length:129 start_codon:yes stop_codon:yes gene_type:complete